MQADEDFDGGRIHSILPGNRSELERERPEQLDREKQVEQEREKAAQQERDMAAQAERLGERLAQIEKEVAAQADRENLAYLDNERSAQRVRREKEREAQAALQPEIQKDMLAQLPGEMEKLKERERIRQEMDMAAQAENQRETLGQAEQARHVAEAENAGQLQAQAAEVERARQVAESKERAGLAEAEAAEMLKREVEKGHLQREMEHQKQMAEQEIILTDAGGREKVTNQQVKPKREEQPVGPLPCREEDREMEEEKERFRLSLRQVRILFELLVLSQWMHVSNMNTFEFFGSAVHLYGMQLLPFCLENAQLA
jgi:colicin import membrane protein